MFSPVYIAFEAPDIYGKDALLGRILNGNMAVECLYPKKDLPGWQEEATALIGRVQAAVVLLSRAAEGAEGLMWEIQQIAATGMPVFYVQVHADPAHQMRNITVPCTVWDWEKIRRFLINAAD